MDKNSIKEINKRKKLGVVGYLIIIVITITALLVLSVGYIIILYFEDIIPEPIESPIAMENPVSEMNFLNPVWTDTHFTNNLMTASPSNGALSNNIRMFYYSYINHLNILYQHRDSTGRYEVDPYMSYNFRRMLSEGFQNDNFSQTKPFNSDFWDAILLNTYFYFASLENETEVHYGGLYVPFGEISHIFVATTDSFFSRNIDRFIFITLHELGHAFGLGESLADLKAELYLGQDTSRQWRDEEDEMYSALYSTLLEEFGHEFRDEIYHYIARERREYELDWIRGEWMDVDLAYSSIFDRVLLNMAGHERFWSAAYTSNAAFGELWNEYMYDLVSHDEIQLIRGLIFEAFYSRPARERHSALERRFNSYTNGLSLNWAASSLLDSFHDFVYQGQLDTSLIDDDSYEYINFRLRVLRLANFALDNDVIPQPSVLDFVMINHLIRNLE